MKKTSKRIVASVILVTLLFVTAITAYAASWKNSGKFSGTGYSGNYSATMNLENDSASASLNISDYVGMVYLGGGAAISGDVVTDKKDTVSLDCFEEGTTCYVHRDFSFPEVDVLYAECKFTYMGFYVTSNTLNLK